MKLKNIFKLWYIYNICTSFSWLAHTWGRRGDCAALEDCPDTEVDSGDSLVYTPEAGPVTVWPSRQCLAPVQQQGGTWLWAPGTGVQLYTARPNNRWWTNGLHGGLSDRPVRREPRGHRRLHSVNLLKLQTSYCIDLLAVTISIFCQWLNGFTSVWPVDGPGPLGIWSKHINDQNEKGHLQN